MLDREFKAARLPGVGRHGQPPLQLAHVRLLDRFGLARFQLDFDLLLARDRDLIAHLQVNRSRPPILHFDFVRDAQAAAIADDLLVHVARLQFTLHRHPIVHAQGQLEFFTRRDALERQGAHEVALDKTDSPGHPTAESRSDSSTSRADKPLRPVLAH